MEITRQTISLIHGERELTAEATQSGTLPIEEEAGLLISLPFFLHGGTHTEYCFVFLGAGLSPSPTRNRSGAANKVRSPSQQVNTQMKAPPLWIKIVQTPCGCRAVEGLSTPDFQDHHGKCGTRYKPISLYLDHSHPKGTDAILKAVEWKLIRAKLRGVAGTDMF